MRVYLKDSSDKIISNQFTPDCTDCIQSCTSQSIQISCPLHNDKRRIGKLSNEMGEVFCCSDNRKYVKSSKIFKNEKETKLLGVEQLTIEKERLNSETKKLLHNLTKTNGHNIQELYALVPQEILTQNLQEQLKTIEEIIKEDPQEAAKTFLRIAKNNAAMKTEFSVFNKLFGANPTLHKKNHPIKKVTLNLFHIYFQKFKELGVYVDVQDNDDYLYIDYESFHVSLYHLIDNASKYILPGTTLHVNFEKSADQFAIIFNMISLRIEEDEIPKLLDEGFSGRHAQDLKKDGDGIGLGRIAKILEINDAALNIKVNVRPDRSIKSKGKWYDNNIFEINTKIQPPE